MALAWRWLACRRRPGARPPCKSALLCVCVCVTVCVRDPGRTKLLGERTHRSPGRRRDYQQRRWQATDTRLR